MPSAYKQPRPPSRSRFQEGSMNDRASAAPPVHFLNDENIPPRASDDYSTEQYYKHSYATVRAVHHEDLAPKPPKQAEKVAVKKSSRIFGQVWDGVFGRFSGKSSGGGGGSRKKTPSMISTASSTNTATTATGDRSSRDVKLDEIRARFSGERPSKEDVMQNYHELVASGFFSSHAIQSTRHSRPNTATATATADRPTSPPCWPLATPNRRHQPHVLSPIAPTPGSASSRGTKRAAASPDPLDGEPPQQMKKLRKSASRDIAVPRLRSVSSKRLLSRRSFSSANKQPDSSTTASPQPSPARQHPPHSHQLLQQMPLSPSKLTKRVPPLSSTGRPTLRAQLPVPGRASSSRRNFSEGVGSPGSDAHPDARILRPRRSALTSSAVKSVVPDEGRGIPGVPVIPPEFTYGEDRQNDGPWRGLRR